MTLNRVSCLFFTMAVCCLSLSSRAQDIGSNPGTYMGAISKARGDMDSKYMQYVSAAAHGRSARKVEKLRQQVLDNITECRYKTTDLPYYKGDNSLRQASIDYIQMVYTIFSEDYKKIVNMEEVAEQSVDEMQAYLILQERINDKLHGAYANLDNANRTFAAKYNVTLSEDLSPLGEKISKAGKLDNHINAVYIFFFKCNWEDNQMVKAMNDKKVNDMEQARNALQSYASEGLKALDTIKPFDGDASLVVSCKKALQGYQKLADKDVRKLTDFYLKQEEFEKMRRSFEAKDASSRTKSDVDAYNKVVNDYNASIKTFNQTNQQVNTLQSQIVNDWNETEKRFRDDHTPHYRS